MKRVLAIAFGLVLVAAPALAGPNAEAELAMHAVASFEYLYCDDLTLPGMYFPADCEGIDNSQTMEDLASSYNYGYYVMLAYNITCISGVEYCIGGWPTQRGGPPTPVLTYCPEGSLVLGAPFDDGGIQGFGTCVCTDLCGGTVGFAYFGWDATAYMGFLPIELFYCQSTWSYPNEPHNYVLACADYNFEEDPVISEHGLTIGGVHWETVPYDDCDIQATATDPTTWGNIKAMYK